LPSEEAGSKLLGVDFIGASLDQGCFTIFPFKMDRFEKERE